VHVQWHDDRIEVSNPGAFPEGVRRDNLLVTAPHPRNPLLADTFKRAGIVERTGRGVDSIYRELLRNGGPAPNYDRSTSSTVAVIMPRSGIDQGFVRLVAEQDRAGRELKLDELLVVRAIIDHRRLGVPDAAVLIQKTESEALAVFEKLTASGLANRTQDAYAPSQFVLAYVVKRQPRQGRFGLTPAEQERRVLDWVRMNKSITRANVEEICGLEYRQATYLLRKLLNSKKLRKVGSRRWTHYVLPEAGL
jgi:ATP-dependent DNA helicase RecG